MLTLPRPKEKYAVLIAEPDEECQGGFDYIFEPSEFDRIFVESGPQAIETVLGRWVDLLIMDMEMGSMTGLEVIRVIHETAPAVPSILLGQSFSKEARLEAMCDHVHACFPKPPNYPLMRRIALEILERHYS